MNHYLEARQWLRPGVEFEVFRERFPLQLQDEKLLSLMLGAVVEQGLQPFERYLELLLKQGADVNYSQYPSKNTINGVKMSLLMLACKKGRAATVQALIEQPLVQVYHRDQKGKNAAHYAIENGDEKEGVVILGLLLRTYPQLREMGNFSQGNYFTMAIREGKHSLVSLLVEEEIDPGYRSLEGLGALHEAVRAHRNHRSSELTLGMLRTLLQAGCKQEELNSEGLTYLNFAREKGYLNESQIQELIEKIAEDTPKATIQTLPEDKLQEIFSLESDEGSCSGSEQSQVEGGIDEPNHEQISQQMYFWAREVQQEHGRVWTILYPFYLHLQRLAHEYYGSVEVIGSFASQLWIPSSDIDIMVFISDNGSPYLFEQITQSFYRKVQALGYYVSIRLLRTYKLPMIKLILNQQFQNLQVQIFLTGSKNNIASRYVSYSNQVINYYPQVVVIYYVLRRLFSVIGMHDHRRGGFKAYALFLLIYSMRSQYQYQYVSQFIEHFCYYYGLAYDYPCEVVDGEVQYRINISDPLNSENNMGGKKTDIVLLREMLKKIYYGINTANQGKKMDYLCQILKFI